VKAHCHFFVVVCKEDRGSCHECDHESSPSKATTLFVAVARVENTGSEDTQEIFLFYSGNDCAELYPPSPKKLVRRSIIPFGSKKKETILVAAGRSIRYLHNLLVGERKGVRFHTADFRITTLTSASFRARYSVSSSTTTRDQGQNYTASRHACQNIV